MDSELADTAEFPVVDKPATPLRVRVDCSGLSDRGLIRPNNEDHFLIAQCGRYLKPLFTNIIDQTLVDFMEEGYGIIVADGVGGHRAGEIASALAIRTLRELVLATPDWIFSATKPENERVMQRMAERITKIDAVLTERAEADSRLAGMATTMTLACSFGPILILAHVGDSRAYLFRGGQLHQLTRDHTKAQALLELGFIKRLEDASEALRGRLMRVVGCAGSHCEADVDRVTLSDQDQILLCTDGLTDMVSDEAIIAVLRDAAGVAEACQRLVAAALQNGGKDNVTVALARYQIGPGS